MEPSDTGSWTRQLEQDGFAALRGFVEPGELSDIVERLGHFIRDIVPRLSPEEAFFEDKGDRRTLKQIQGIADHDPWFRQLFHEGSFRSAAEAALGKPVIPKNLQYFNKPPGVGKPTPAHQDGYYFMLEPCEAVTMWLALEDVDEENGCVRYVRGSHRQGLRSHSRTTVLGFSQGITDYPTEQDRQNEAKVPATAGDLLIHHAMTIHRADGNRSTHRTRRALGFVYYSVDAQVDAQRHAAYQAQLAQDMKSKGMI